MNGTNLRLVQLLIKKMQDVQNLMISFFFSFQVVRLNNPFLKLLRAHFKKLLIL